MRQLTYKGYDVTQSILTHEWYADPICAITTCDRLRAPNAVAMKALIDEATAKDRPNPWELPFVGEVARTA
jgi:hypothetical protein